MSKVSAASSTLYREGEKLYIAQFPLIENIISIWAAAFTSSIGLCLCVLYMCMFLWNIMHTLSCLWTTFFPSWYNMLGGWWATLSAIVFALAEDCRKLCLARGPEARWGQTLSTNTRWHPQIYRHAAYLLCSTFEWRISVVQECACTRMSRSTFHLQWDLERLHFAQAP